MRFYDEVVEQLCEALDSMRLSLLGIEVFEWPGHMLCEREGMKAFGYCCLDDFFECVVCMAAKLARVAMMRVGHVEVAARLVYRAMYRG